MDKRIFLAKIILFAVMIWQPAVAQMSSLPACTAVDDTDNDGVDSTIDVDKDGDGLIEVCDIEGLNEMRYQLDGSGYTISTDAVKITQGCPATGCKGYELMRSLDFNVADSYRGNMVNTTWTTGANWQPIGSNTNRFSSIFEGNGHTISNLYIKAESQLGLFSVLRANGRIQNVGLLDVDVEGTEDFIGGLVGFSDGSVINSYVTGAVTGTGDNVGGLVGSNSGDITNSYATGVVTGTGDNVGGLVGSNGGDITDSYATGAVTGNSEVGGLVGFSRGNITNSYATGAVTGNDNVGGLVGFNRGNITNSYWNAQTSGLTTSTGGNGVTSATTVQLQSPTAPGTTTTEVYYGWSSDDWDFGTSSQYPILKKSDDTLLSPTLRYGLSQLRLAKGHLSPDFISIIPNYTGSVVVDTNTIQLIPIAINANARIHITGRGTQEIASGATSDDIMLNEDGITTITIVVMTAGVSIEYNFNLRYYQYSGDVDIDNDGLIEIDNIEDLDAIRYQSDGTGYKKGTAPKITTGCPSTGCKGYELTKSLSFAEDSDWSPIALFSGIFEGNGYTISKLRINKPNANSVGLFSSITSGAKINNIGLLDIDIQGHSRVGGLVGFNYGRITNSYAMGAVTGNWRVGGLVGFNYGRITNSYATGAVTGNSEVGGLVGLNRGSITNSYATGVVTGNWDVGGLVGSNGGFIIINGVRIENGSITNSYATGAVTGNWRVGGLVSINYGRITNSYATGAVTGNDNVGGLVGSNSGDITNSYATGVVTGNSNVGGLVGWSFRGSVTNSYWNTQTSGLATSAGGDGVTSATTAQLQSPTAPGMTTTEVYYGWSSDDWDFGTSSQYPILKKSDGTLLSPTLRYGLSQLRLAKGHLSPDFISIIPNYIGSVVVDTNTIQLIPIAINANARIHITGRGTQEIASGATSDDIMLNEDGITTITIVVVTAGISIEYNFNLRYYQYSGDVDIDNDGLIEIDNIEGLNAIRYQPDGTGYRQEVTAPKITTGCPSTGCKGYELTRNLSFAEDSDWSPIVIFSGIFEGNGYTISNLTISKPNAIKLGLFGSTVFGSKINNIGLLDIDIQGDSRVGSLVGYNVGDITNSYATGSVAGTDDVGGLVGYNGGNITNSYATGSVAGTDDVGGLVGYNGGNITNSYATGSVAGTDDVGGLVGLNYGDITNSYATEAVTGLSGIGGLAGSNNGDITNSYATGAVTGLSGVGGLVGFNYDNGNITNSYATGAVTGTGDNVGGLVGDNGGSVTNSYATGVVTGNSNVGGLVGSNRGSVTNSYATGAVTGNSNVGGLVGSNRGSVTNSYATGAVTGNSNVGGLVGSNRGSVTNSYWNTQTSGLATSAGGDGVTSATTVQLQSPTAPGTTTTEVYYGWSSDDWDFGTPSQYPILKKSDGTLLSPTLRYGLSQLRLAKGHLSPDFISIIPNYTGSVVVDTNTIQLIPIAINANARIHITSGGTQEIASGATSDDIMLNEDGITTITIVVMTAGISIEYNFNLRYYQYSGDVDIDNDGLIEIDNIEDLSAIRYQSDGTGYKKGTAPKITTGCPSTDCKGYELTRNLSFAADSDWSPIALFSGIFEGNGYTISKLRINKPNASNLGLFSSITSGAKINNIGLLDIDIQGGNNVGGLVGENYGRITNSYATGAVTGTGDEVGGLVGFNGGDITNSYATGAVTGNSRVGGLVGDNDEGDITNSYATGAVTGNSRVGGLVGDNDEGDITNSYATGAVTGNSRVGGLVGDNDEGDITNSYATGAVTGNWSVGGLVGNNGGFSSNGGDITNSYATGAVTGNSNVGGLVGDNDEGDITNSYATGAVTGNSRVGGLVGDNDEGDITNSYATGAVTGTGYSVGGLVGSNGVGSVTNSYATGAVTGTGYSVGGLVGDNGDFSSNGGDITNSYATGAVTGNSNVGGLVGDNGDFSSNGGDITNSYATGAVTGTGYSVGGLVGSNGVGSVTDSYATGVVTGNSSVGGLVGNNGGFSSNGGDITNSYATGAVTGNSNVGGLVGNNGGFSSNGGDITNSYATGAVTGNSRVGGLVGDNDEGDITNSYATGAVTGNSRVGGLVGDNDEGDITNSYATGAVTGNWSVGGLVGSNRGSVTNSYWNTQTSGLATSAGGDGVTSANTAQLQSPTAPGTTTTEVYYGWSSDDWDFGTSLQYPILKKSDGTLLSPTLRYGLSQLRLAKGYLSPDFISIIPNYTGSVVGDTNTIQLIPIAINANARIHITGGGKQEIASGATSDDIMLNENGITTITIVVVTAGISIEYNFNLHYYQYAGDVDIDNDGLIEIDNIEDLNAIRYQLDGTGYKKEAAPKITTGCPSTGCKGYELTKSLSFAEDSNWSPIVVFSGIFEGNGYTISKLRINKPNASNLGFFSSITSGAKINNIGLLDIDIQGDWDVGGLVGENYGHITNSYATGAVTGDWRVGGLVGSNGGSITNSYAAGAVTGDWRVGGLVGENYGHITNSYAAGAVTGNSWVGGLVGENDGDITNSYATGTVTGNSGVGGFVGWNFRGSVTNSYWNTQTSGLTTSAGGDGVTSATTAQLQSPTAPGTMTTEVYYGWSSDDWDFGDNSHYPALRHARGDDLNACNPDITTPSAILACAVPLPNQRDRNQGLTALFVLADGDDVTAELIPTFFPLKSSYDNIIVTTETAVQLILRPYAVNNNATITITDQDNADYFVDKPNGALSDPIMLSDSITLTLVVTDTIDEATIGTTYTFIIKREDPLEVLGITVNLESATNADGTINEASMASILFDVVGGVGSYRYEYKIIVGTEEILLSQSEPPVELTIPDNIVAIESTQQTIELNIIVSDSGGQTFEYRETLTIQKVDNGVAELDISRETSRTLIAMMGADPDGAIDDSAYQWQWRGPGAAAQWMDLESATSTSYTITDELAVDGNEFRIQVAYTDGQGYRYDALYSKTMKYDLLPRCTLAIADRDNDGVESSIDVDKDGDGLIELCDLESIDEMRYQADGRGYRPNENAINIMRGCPLVDGEEHCRGYELMRSLDFNAADSYRNHTTSSKWTTTSGWLPIVANYSAVFEGNGHSISGLYIARTKAASGFGQGLFSTLGATAQIKNIRLLDVNIQGLSVVGAVASRNSGIIINSSVIGAVEANADVGGLVGINDGHIISSFADVAVSATTNSGGLVGRNQGLMTNSYTSGNVTASGDNIGGLVGLNSELGRITNTYAEGTVVGASQVGGLVGSHYGMIMNSYAAIGGVSGSGSHLGGLIGMASSTATVIASYWDTERSGIESSGGGSGKTTAELQMPIVPGTTATEVYYRWNTSDWDFGDSNHYPALRYASGADPAICTTDITTSSAVLPCTILLPEQRGRNKGLAEVFFFAGGEVASVILTPPFTLLTDSYDMTIIIPENTDPKMQLRPYAINDNAMIVVTEPGSATDYYAGKSNSELSDTIVLGDETILRIAVTDSINGDVDHTTYTFTIANARNPLAISEFMIEPSATIDEGSHTTITYTVSGGSGVYEYAYKIDDGDFTQSSPSFIYRAPVDLVAVDADMQTVRITIRVSDQDKAVEVLEYSEEITVRKINNGGSFNITSEIDSSQLRMIEEGSDPDGDGRFSYQWQQLGLAGEWMDIEGATTASYSFGDTNGSVRYRVNIQHTDGQGYITNYQPGPFRASSDDDADGLIDIYYLEDLNALRYQLDGSGYQMNLSSPISSQGCPATGCIGYELMRSLDFNVADSYQDSTVDTAWTTSTGWQPIGSDTNRFSGIFEGNGHTIANLFMDRTESNLGLFSVLHTNGRIQNIGLLDAEVVGTKGIISGLVSINYGAIINSYVTGEITGTGDFIGGLVSSNEGAIINSYATGTISGTSRVGGLVGVNDGSIINSYAMEDVTGRDNVGGLVGVNNSGAIINSYATGLVRGNSNVGGLIGVNSGSVTASYWNTQTSDQLTSAGDNGVTSATTVQLQSPTAPGTTTTKVYYGWSRNDWDFGDNTNYPALRYAVGDDLNGCEPDITTSTKALPCGILLPNQRGRNKGLAGVFFFADDVDVSAEIMPQFTPLTDSYNALIITSGTNVRLTLRPYALNSNSTITITDQGNEDYFVGKPNGALSDPIMLSDPITLTLVVTDTINEVPVNTTYTVTIKRAISLKVSAITLSPDPATPIDEGDTITLTFDVSGGGDAYQYEYLIDDQPLPSPSQPPFEFTLATDIVDAAATMQIVKLTIRVSDDDGQTFEYSEDLTIRKVNNGDPVVTSEMNSKYLRIIFGGSDADSAGDFVIQWQSQVASGDWMDIVGATTVTYWLPAITDNNLRRYRANIDYTDGQGYMRNYQPDPFPSAIEATDDISSEASADEGNTLILTAPAISGGGGEYRYEWIYTAEDSMQLSGKSTLTLTGTTTTILNVTIPADFIALAATSANIIFKVVMSDDFTMISRSKAVTINKIDNGPADITITSGTLSITVNDPDGNATDPNYIYQWQQRTPEAGSSWENIDTATAATYNVPDGTPTDIRFRVSLTYTDGQGYDETVESTEIAYLPLVKGIKVRTKVFLEGPLR